MMNRHSEIKILVVLTLFVLSSCGLFRHPVAATFNITQTDEYCGGAPPPEDLIEELARPKVIPDQVIYISAANKKQYIPLSVTDGKGTLKLKPGKYEVRVNSPETTEKFISEYNIPEDMFGCYRDWLDRVVAEFELTEDMSTVEFNIHMRCDPCAPLPP